MRTATDRFNKLMLLAHMNNEQLALQLLHNLFVDVLLVDSKMESTQKKLCGDCLRAISLSTQYLKNTEAQLVALREEIESSLCLLGQEDPQLYCNLALIALINATQSKPSAGVDLNLLRSALKNIEVYASFDGSASDRLSASMEALLKLTWDV